MSSVDVEKLSKECQTMLPLLSAYIDGELTDQERVKVEGHLDDCPLCRLALEEMTEASKSYRGLIPLIPLAGIRQAIESRMGPMGSGPAGQAAADAGQTPSDASALSGTTEKLPQVGAEGGIGGGGDGIGGGEEAAAARQASGQGLSTFAGSVSRTQRIALGILLMALFVAVGVFGATVILLPPPSAPSPSTLQISQPVTGEAGSAVATETTGGVTDLEGPPITGERPPEPPTEPQGGGSPEPTPDSEPPATPVQISPADDAVLSDRRVTLEWQPVGDPSGVTYSLEIQVFLGGGAGYGALDTASRVSGAHYSHTLGDMTERWRVWAVDGAGNASTKSGWRNMTKTADDPEPSTEPTDPTIY
jgi:anti-sigma factor RsiW